MPRYTVVATYDYDDQPYVDHFEADTPEDAMRMAMEKDGGVNESTLKPVAVFEGELTGVFDFNRFNRMVNDIDPDLILVERYSDGYRIRPESGRNYDPNVTYESIDAIKAMHGHDVEEVEPFDPESFFDNADPFKDE